MKSCLHIGSLVCGLLLNVSVHAQAPTPPLGSVPDPTVNSQFLENAKDDPGKYRILKAELSPGKEEALVTYYWKVGYEIRVAFEGGTEEDRQLVKDAASPWFEHANLKVKYIDQWDDAEVRIKINSASGPSFSYLGTASQTVDKGKPTMTLSVPLEIDRNALRRVIMHEFGHMLGFPSENANPNMASANINWEGFYQFASSTWGMNKEYVNTHFRPQPSHLYAGKPFDPNSIMMHPIPARFFDGDIKPSAEKAELSIGDKAFLARIYPPTPTVLAETEAIISDTKSLSLKASLQKSANLIKKFETVLQDTALADTVSPAAAPTPSTTPEQVKDRSDQALRTEEEIIKEYAKYRSRTPEEAKEAAMKLAGLYMAARENSRKENRNKAVYGLDDTFSPEIYADIHRNSLSVGSLMTKGKERLGTCFMIGKDLVLTCRHCLIKPETMGDRFPIANLVVNFETNPSDLNKAFKVASLVFEGKAGKHCGVDHVEVDYALLSLGKNKDGKLPSELGISPLLINADSEIPRDVPVYVVGFPGSNGNKTVADNTRVFAGFSNNTDTIISYELQVQEEIMFYKKEAEKESDPSKRLEALRVADQLGVQMMKAFGESFKSGDTVPTRWYLISSLLSKTKPAHPAFALDSDTYHGNSGSPVFARRSSDVIGVFFRGIDDRYVNTKVGWLRHEEAIPIHMILENWKKHEPDQPSAYAVEF